MYLDKVGHPTDWYGTYTTNPHIQLPLKKLAAKASENRPKLALPPKEMKLSSTPTMDFQWPTCCEPFRKDYRSCCRPINLCDKNPTQSYSQFVQILGFFEVIFAGIIFVGFFEGWIIQGFFLPSSSCRKKHWSVLTFPRHPKSSQYLVSRCLEPLNAFSGDDWGFKHLLPRYLDV